MLCCPGTPAQQAHTVHLCSVLASCLLQVRLYDGELESARWCALEEASLDGSRLLAYLPGSILVNREPLGSSFQPDICPNRITRSVLTAVYDLLQVGSVLHLACLAGCMLTLGQGSPCLRVAVVTSVSN